jgi:hypothetical protein
VEAEISAPKGNILADQMISLPGTGKNAKALCLFRRLAVWEAGQRENVSVAIIVINFPQIA